MRFNPRKVRMNQTSENSETQKNSKFHIGWRGPLLMAILDGSHCQKAIKNQNFTTQTQLKKSKSKLKLRKLKSLYLEWWSHGSHFCDYCQWFKSKMTNDMIADHRFRQRSPPPKLEF